MLKATISKLCTGVLAVSFIIPMTGCADNEKTPAKTADKAKTAAVKAATEVKAEKEAVSQAQLWSFLPDVVATYGGKKLSKKEFINDFNDRMKLAPMPPQLNSQMLQQGAPKMIESMVDRLLLVDVAAAAGFKVDQAAAEAIIRRNLAKMPQQQALLKKSLEMRNQTLESYIKEYSSNSFIRQNIAVGEWIEKTVVPTIKVTDAEAKDYYEKNKQRFTRPGDAPGSFRASHILIRPKDEKKESDAAAKAEAEAILAQLKKGASFEKLAAEKSACPSGKRGGSLGAFGPGMMVPEFEDATKKLKPGELSGVVKTKFGYHIIRRDKAQLGSVAKFEDVKERIIEILKRNAITAKVEKTIKDLRAKNKVEVLVKAPAIAAAAAAPPVKTVAPAAVKK